MVCPSCRNPNGPCPPGDVLGVNAFVQQFDVVLDESCWRRMYVPCNVRGFLAEYIEEKKDASRMMQNKQLEPALLTHEGRSYDALFKHRPNYTKFYGNAWVLFSHDYALNAGDRIVFFLDDWGLNLKVDTYRGGERLLPLRHVAFDHLSNVDYEHAESCVYSGNIELNYPNTRRFVGRLYHDIYIRCRPFVYVLTVTNIQKSIMKIPKSIVSSLKSFVDIPTTAGVVLDAPYDGLQITTPSSFSICKQDGRMVIEKNTFREFISAIGWIKDNVLLITFKEHNDRSVSIVFQRIC